MKKLHKNFQTKQNMFAFGVLGFIAFLLMAPFAFATGAVIGIGMFVSPLLAHIPAGVFGETAPAKKELTDDEKSFIDRVKSEVSTLVENLLGTKSPKIEDYNSLKTLVATLSSKEDLQLLQGKLTEMGLTVKSLTDRGIPSATSYKTLGEQIKAAMGADADAWKDFVNGKSKGFSFDINFGEARKAAKAAGTMTVTGNTNSDLIGRVEMIPGFVDLTRDTPFMEDFANVSGTNSPTIKWTEKQNPQGQAEFLAEGELKPLVDWDWVKKSTSAKKVADAIKISTEMLEDIDFMAAAIEGELKYQVDILTDEQELSGDGLGDNLKGLTEYAGGFVLTTVQSDDPNDADAIRAAIAQIKSLNFAANYAFINPIDAANLDMKKSDDGMYLIPPFQTADGTKIKGVTVVESNQIPVGDVLVADMTRFMIRNYKPFRVTYGWENDDFRKNLVTILGERRLHTFMADNNTGAFVYDTLSNIKTAIALPAAP